jgi:hypothetical protein
MSIAKPKSTIIEAQAAEGVASPRRSSKRWSGRHQAKFLGEITLLGQPFVKDDKLTVEKLLAGAKAGWSGTAPTKWARASRRSSPDDFAAEVMAQVRASRLTKTPLRRGIRSDRLACRSAAYRRILLKLSGEALMGSDDYGINRPCSSASPPR